MTPTPAVSAKEKAREIVADILKMRDEALFTGDAFEADEAERRETAEMILAALSATEGEAEPVGLEPLKKVVAAWEALPGGRNYDKSVVQRWLVGDMKPAIDEARATIASVDPLFILVARFASALLEKLRAAERKYGYSDAWMQGDWQDDLVKHLHEHIAKGDPRDVAAYCAFAWHHGWPLYASPPSAPAGVKVKPLEWHAVTAQRSDEDPRTEETGDHTASTPFGCYYIEMYFGSDSYGWGVSFNGDDVADKDDPDGAKAVAQADYEQRIRSSLQPDTQAAAVSAPEGVYPYDSTIQPYDEPFRHVGAERGALKAFITRKTQLHHEHPIGTVVYEFAGYDYGCASEDTAKIGTQYRAYTLNKDGSEPFFTHPVNGVAPFAPPLEDSKATLADANPIASAPAQEGRADG